MKNTNMENKLTELLIRDEPREPHRIELGAGYYFKCPWAACDTDINRYMNFCPGCGQRIDWSEK